jgi:hypothetical protein
MDHDPQIHGELQSKPNQIARGLVYGRKAFALRTANPHRHGHERADKQRRRFSTLGLNLVPGVRVASGLSSFVIVSRGRPDG